MAGAMDPRDWDHIALYLGPSTWYLIDARLYDDIGENVRAQASRRRPTSGLSNHIVMKGIERQLCS